MFSTNISANGGPLEKDFSKNGGVGYSHTEAREDTLHRIQTAGSITISPEIFEKIYLTPANKVKGDLRFKFANPTPL
jgi:hypothetical protein